MVDAYDSFDYDADQPLTSEERLGLPIAIARQPLWSIGGWVAQLDDESMARSHAAATALEIKWALNVMDDIDRWQTAFA